MLRELEGWKKVQKKNAQPYYDERKLRTFYYYFSVTLFHPLYFMLMTLFIIKIQVRRIDPAIIHAIQFTKRERYVWKKDLLVYPQSVSTYTWLLLLITFAASLSSICVKLMFMWSLSFCCILPCFILWLMKSIWNPEIAVREVELSSNILLRCFFYLCQSRLGRTHRCKQLTKSLGCLLRLLWQRKYRHRLYTIMGDTLFEFIWTINNFFALPGSPQMVIAIRRDPKSRAVFNATAYNQISACCHCFCLMRRRRFKAHLLEHQNPKWWRHCRYRKQCRKKSHLIDCQLEDGSLCKGNDERRHYRWDEVVCWVQCWPNDKGDEGTLFFSMRKGKLSR